MALPKKGSRKITVGNMNYRYLISLLPKRIDLVVQLEDGEGQKLVVSFNDSYYRSGASGLLIPKEIIKPAKVKETIEYALKMGWQPDKKGKELKLINPEKEITFD